MLNDIDQVISLINEAGLVGYPKKLPYESLMHFWFSAQLMDTNFSYFPVFNDSNFCDGFIQDQNCASTVYLIEHKFHMSARGLHLSQLDEYSTRYFKDNINVIQLFRQEQGLVKTNLKIQPSYNRFYNPCLMSDIRNT